MGKDQKRTRGLLHLVLEPSHRSDRPSGAPNPKNMGKIPSYRRFPEQIMQAFLQITPALHKLISSI